jgi:hypothetical protein
LYKLPATWPSTHPNRRAGCAPARDTQGARDSHLEWFESNFADYEKDKKRRLGTDSVIPHRVKHKQFSRLLPYSARKPISKKNSATHICATKPRSGAGSKLTSRLAAFGLAADEPFHTLQDF